MQAQRCVASRQVAFSGRTVTVRPQRFSRSIVAVKVLLQLGCTPICACWSVSLCGAAVSLLWSAMRFGHVSQHIYHIELMQAVKVGENLKDSAEYYRSAAKSTHLNFS